ncbi:hypothetical protein PybrP1_000625 [[Pythium] brassicae (nom. inval.)]|nr:hypothetical protein PybrP1_000625 [[Pythium] brassicae (nom. inval.)]
MAANEQQARERRPADEVEMALRVDRVEQQVQELPAQWRQLTGAPMHMSHFGTQINTFRANPALQPTAAYVRSALQALKHRLASSSTRFSEAELEEIIRQEWRTDMTRCVLESRLNRHHVRDGPVVRRSASGVVYVRAQPTAGERFIRDAMAPSAARRKKT